MSKCCVNSVTGYFLPLFAPPNCNSFHQNSFQDTIGVMSMRPVHYLSIEDYPEIERGLETRNGYLAGVMYAMSGSTAVHALLLGATAFSLGGQLRGRDCVPFIADLRLYVVEAPPDHVFRSVCDLRPSSVFGQAQGYADRCHCHRGGSFFLDKKTTIVATSPTTTRRCRPSAIIC